MNAEQSGNTSDLKSVIQGAISQVLQNNGTDPQSVAQQALGAHGHHHHGHGGGAGQTAGAGGTTDAAASLASLLTNSSTSSDTSSGSNSQQPSDMLAQLLGLPAGQGVSGLLLDKKQ